MSDGALTILRPRLVDLLAQGERITSMMTMGADTDDEMNAQLAEFDRWLDTCEDKAQACKIVLVSLADKAERFKAAEKQIAERRRMLEAHADKLKERTLLLAQAMLESTGKSSVDLPDGGRLTVTKRTTFAVDVQDPLLLPEGCGKWTFVPDKAAIKDVYKQAGEVSGATVTEVPSVSLTVK